MSVARIFLLSWLATTARVRAKIRRPAICQCFFSNTETPKAYGMCVKTGREQNQIKVGNKQIQWAQIEINKSQYSVNIKSAGKTSCKGKNESTAGKGQE